MQATYDIYRNIHKALRACLADTMLRLGRLDCEDDAEVRTVLEQVRSVAAFMAGHLFHEDCFVHPALEARRPGSAAVTAHEHADHDAMCRRLIVLAATAELARGGDRVALVRQLYQRVSLFLAESITHMHMEETDNNAVLWATHTDAELASLERAIVDSLTPDEKAASMRWMIPALSPQERAALLQGVRRGVPPPVFAGMLEGVRDLLGAADRDKLEAALARQDALAA
jgi:hypothetical protein